MLLQSLVIRYATCLSGERKKGAKIYILAPAVFLPCLDHAALLLARQLLVIVPHQGNSVEQYHGIS